MDSSPRHHESGSPRPSTGRAQAAALPPLDLVAWLHSSHVAGPSGSHRPERDRARVTPAPSRPGSQYDDRLARPAAYLAKVPPAIAGQRGHNQTFQAACVLVQGFDLTIDEARPLLHQWNLGCVPPWTTAELEHKLQDALKARDSRPRGYLWDRGSSSPQGKTLRRDPRHEGHRHGSPPSPFHAGNPVPSSPSLQSEPCPDGHEANPHRLAQQFLLADFAFAGGIGLRYWRDEFHSWDGTLYHVVPASEMRARATRWTADEFERLYRLSLLDLETAGGSSSGPGAGGTGPARAVKARSVPRPIPVTGRVVSDVLQALASLVMVSSRQVPAQPAWLPAWPERIAAPALSGDPVWEPAWPAVEILPAQNALVHLPSLMAGAPHSTPPSPRFFNAHALEYDFDPAAPSPHEWLSFLEQIWGPDTESIGALQEWFGYLLTPDTRQQKILMMVGPKRSGRGTIARVLKSLAGSNTVVNPTLSTLARPFGLSTFIGKPIAVFPDARLSSRPDNAAIVECLLSISGEDDQTIDRKHMPAWTGKLSTRFVLISNELPRLRDVSGALAGRLIILRFTRSFYGHEDMALFDRLQPELPGILCWAIAGWERLNRRGRFLQPRSARELVATMDELASPIAAFLRDRCIVEADAICPVPAMYEAWRSWCQERGRDAVGDEHSFGRDLHAAIPALATIRPRTPLGRLRHYQGVRLRTTVDADADTERADTSTRPAAEPRGAF
jgi:putative DNA primase/helicase